MQPLPSTHPPTCTPHPPTPPHPQVERLSDPLAPCAVILQRVPKKQLMAVYKIAAFADVDEFLRLIAAARGKLKRGGVPDMQVGLGWGWGWVWVALRWVGVGVGVERAGRAVLVLACLHVVRDCECDSI